MVWRGPSTVYPDSTNVLRNLAPMMWPWQALGNLWCCQTAVSHLLIASVAQMPSSRPDQRLKHGRQAELFPRSPDASALGVVYYAGLAPPARSVVIVARRALVATIEEGLGNPSSSHTRGRAARAHVDDARARVAAALGVLESEVVFTSGATEANNGMIREACRGRLF